MGSRPLAVVAALIIELLFIPKRFLEFGGLRIYCVECANHRIARSRFDCN